MNNPAEIAKVAAEAGLSPSVQMLLIIVGILMMLAMPAMLLLRDWKKSGKATENEGRTSDIQTGLYSHLYEQVTLLTKRLDAVHTDYNEMVKLNSKLEARIQALEGCEEVIKKLQQKLDDKDLALSARDTQIMDMFADIRARDQKIIELQERVNSLEMRVTADERDFRKATGQDTDEVPSIY